MDRIDLALEVPVIQGGMGVGVSLSHLAGAVSKHGGLGVISAAQIGFKDAEFEKNPIETNLRVLKEEIKKAKEIAGGKPIGVNIMVVTQRYEDYVKAAVLGGADVIISGAGLPMDLPKYVENSSTLIAPIVSSKRALLVILKYWKKHYQKVPDFVVIEGPLAGGHLGFSKEELDAYDKKKYDEEIMAILALANQEEIPVYVAGGIYSRADLEYYQALGAKGVQLGTRFVTTYECDASEAYKKTYLDAKEEDIVIVKSPVGLPGRAIRNKFLEDVEKGNRSITGCKRCISTCNPATTPYCITDALIHAVNGQVEDGLLFCGANAYRATEICHVSEILEEFRI